MRTINKNGEMRSSNAAHNTIHQNELGLISLLSPSVHYQTLDAVVLMQRGSFPSFICVHKIMTEKKIISNVTSSSSFGSPIGLWAGKIKLIEGSNYTAPFHFKKALVVHCQKENLSCCVR